MFFNSLYSHLPRQPRRRGGRRRRRPEDVKEEGLRNNHLHRGADGRAGQGPRWGGLGVRAHPGPVGGGEGPNQRDQRQSRRARNGTQVRQLLQFLPQELQKAQWSRQVQEKDKCPQQNVSAEPWYSDWPHTPCKTQLLAGGSTKNWLLIPQANT